MGLLGKGIFTCRECGYNFREGDVHSLALENEMCGECFHCVTSDVFESMIGEDNE